MPDNLSIKNVMRNIYISIFIPNFAEYIEVLIWESQSLYYVYDKKIFFAIYFFYACCNLFMVAGDE